MRVHSLALSHTCYTYILHLRTCRCVPRIEMTYDHRHRFLLKVTFTVDKKTSFATEEELVKILLQDLILAGAMCMLVVFGVC